MTKTFRTCDKCGGIVAVDPPAPHKCDPWMVKYWETKGPHIKRKDRDQP